MPWSAHRPQPGLDPSQPERDANLEVISRVLDPVLVPLGFAAAQVGAIDDRGQITFCRGDSESPDGGCMDLVIDVEASPDWRISDVRYWGFPSDRWHLEFDREAPLARQVAGLASSLPRELA
ncbi:MAG TPA: hypothetical protein VHQ42_08980 [Candidatus Limnocylindria bacterium]|nr:hypothetical protein [Candidatus Limnocylindria bacterium]